MQVDNEEFKFLVEKMNKAGYNDGIPFYFTVYDGAIYVFPKKMKGVEIKIST